MTAQRSPNNVVRDRMADYVPVNERIAAFYEKHPEGSIQSEMVELSESRVVMRAFAYRSPDDPRPGIGYSSMTIPGSTSFTRGSEVENCETSAWGRAIASLGFEVKRGIATKEEVENKQEEPSRPARISPLRSNAAAPELDEEDAAALFLRSQDRPDDPPWDYAAFRAAIAAIPKDRRPDLPRLITTASKLFPTKDVELHEPKMWKLSDREWRQLAVALGVIAA